MWKRVLLGTVLIAAGCGQTGSVHPATSTPESTAASPDVASEAGTESSTPRAPRGRGGLPRGQPTLLDTADAGARVEDQIDASTSATAFGLTYRARLVPGFPGLYEFVLNNTGSGWQEKFLLQVPRNTPSTPVPLVVVFHKFGSSHFDVLNTGLLNEVRTRGWYLVAPLGARQKNFGNLESQINIRAALDLVVNLMPIDRDRVYGVGFSMGGGSLANYAARHVDPMGVMFAAICDHTGGVSLAHTYANEPDDSDQDDDQPNPGDNLEVPDVLEDLFGGSPQTHGFAYRRSSSIGLDPSNGTIEPATDFARNVAHIPTLVWMASNDPFLYLVNQTQSFFQHIQFKNAANDLHLVPASVHQWTTLNPGAVCDWLATKRLTMPRNGSILADENGVWFRYQIEQSVSGAFTVLDWDVDSGQQLLTLTSSRNLHRVSVDSPMLGLVLSGPVTIDVSSVDGTGDRVRLLGVASAPLSVTRDGQLTVGTYDPIGQSFEIHEPDGALHRWVITFP